MEQNFDLEAAVAKLSAAQQEALRSAVGAPPFCLTRFEHGRSADALAARRLAYPRACPGAPVCLTPRGIEARNLLRARLASLNDKGVGR